MTLEICPDCGASQWTPIPDSLAEFCKCGFVRVGAHGEYERGASLQEWAAHQAELRAKFTEARPMTQISDERAKPTDFEIAVQRVTDWLVKRQAETSPAAKAFVGDITLLLMAAKSSAENSAALLAEREAAGKVRAWMIAHREECRAATKDADLPDTFRNILTRRIESIDEALKGKP